MNIALSCIFFNLLSQGRQRNTWRKSVGRFPMSSHIDEWLTIPLCADIFICGVWIHSSKKALFYIAMRKLLWISSRYYSHHIVAQLTFRLTFHFLYFGNLSTLSTKDIITPRLLNQTSLGWWRRNQTKQRLRRFVRDLQIKADDKSSRISCLLKAAVPQMSWIRKPEDSHAYKRGDGQPKCQVQTGQWSAQQLFIEVDWTACLRLK